MSVVNADHPHTDPSDGRTECDVCGKWVHECTHSCKRVPVTGAAWVRWHQRNGILTPLDEFAKELGIDLDPLPASVVGCGGIEP